MTKEEFEKLKSTVKQWLFHIGTLDPIEYANELRINFIEPREKQIEKLKKENTELKENYRKRGDIIISLEKQLRLNIHSDNLTKAKELLITYKDFLEYEGLTTRLGNLYDRTIRFLKET